MSRQSKQLIANIAYEVHAVGDRIARKNRLQVLSADETLQRIREENLSLIRFGDSDITFIRGRSTDLQVGGRQLSDDLRTVLRANEEGLMIAIPDIFGDHSLDQYVPMSRKFWKDHLLFCRGIYYENCCTDITYGNSFVSRPYIIMQDKTRCGRCIDEFRQIWLGANVTVVEGAGTHTGVNNDLLDTAASVERILCPPSNAYGYYTEILEACLDIDKGRLVLLSVGATAKILGLALFHQGYRVLDIGNLDVEYEWYLAGAMDKIRISKHSIITEEENRQEGYTQYLSEVVERIGC